VCLATAISAEAGLCYYRLQISCWCHLHLGIGVDSLSKAFIKLLQIKRLNAIAVAFNRIAIHLDYSSKLSLESPTPNSPTVVDVCVI